MKIQRLSVLSAVGAFCLALLVFFGCDNPSTPLTLEDLKELTQPPPKPGPSLTPGDGHLYVQFTKVVGATGYRIYWNTVASPDPTDPAKCADVGQPETSQLVDYTIEPLSNGTQYWVWAAALFEGGRSKYSEPDTAMPRARPAAPPSGLLAFANDGALDLTWNRVSDADSYYVYYSASGGGATPPEGTPHNEFYADKDYAVMGYVSGLDNGTTYDVWIRAHNTSGESDGYTHASGQPAAGGGAPSLVSGQPGLAQGNERLVVTWDAVKRATGYKLYYSTTSTMGADAVSVNAGAGRMTGSVPDLTNGTSYWVWVVAVNGMNESSPSSPNNEKPYPPPPLNMSNPSMVIGYAAARFPNEEAGKGDRLSRKQETALADLVADSMYEWADKHKSEYSQNKIDFAFVNGGIIVNAMAAGPISVQSITRALHPEGDRMSIVTMSGAQVKLLFEERVAQVGHSGGGGSGTGAFGQVSSQVRYTIDYNYGPRDGVMKNLTFNGEPFNPIANYTLVTNTYLVNGGDGYYTYLHIDSPTDTNKLIAEAVCEWIYEQDEEITPKTDGRIVLEREVWQ
jgi:hypothetical protein